MREYELTFIAQPELSDEGIQAIRERLEGILEKHGATRLFYEDAGRRRLAYEIRNFQKGQYVTLFYLDEGKAVPELERALRLDDSVLRFLTVLANERVVDVEARKAEAIEIERIRAEKAAERAAREAEEAARAAEEIAQEAERRDSEEAEGGDSEEAEGGDFEGVEADDADVEVEEALAEASDADREG
jgi:small subunit ribosomal protein S6